MLDLEAFRISGLYVYTPQTKATTFFGCFQMILFPSFSLCFSGFFVFSTAMRCRNLKAELEKRPLQLEVRRGVVAVGWVPGCSLVGVGWFVGN